MPLGMRQTPPCSEAGDVNGAIHRAGGKAILPNCEKIKARQGGCKVGEAVITTRGNLPAKHEIHTVGPVWNGINNKEEFVGGIAEFKINSQ